MASMANCYFAGGQPLTNSYNVIFFLWLWTCLSQTHARFDILKKYQNVVFNVYHGRSEIWHYLAMWIKIRGTKYNSKSSPGSYRKKYATWWHGALSLGRCYVKPSRGFARQLIHVPHGHDPCCCPIAIVSRSNSNSNSNPPPPEKKNQAFWVRTRGPHARTRVRTGGDTVRTRVRTRPRAVRTRFWPGGVRVELELELAPPPPGKKKNKLSESGLAVHMLELEFELAVTQFELAFELAPEQFELDFDLAASASNSNSNSHPPPPREKKKQAFWVRTRGPHARTRVRTGGDTVRTRVRTRPRAVRTRFWPGGGRVELELELDPPPRREKKKPFRVCIHGQALKDCELSAGKSGARN